jgi:hypothetical protein
MIETWLLWSWLCAGPGPGGECAPQPDRVIEDDRGACLRAAREARAKEPKLVAHCRRVKAEAAPAP